MLYAGLDLSRKRLDFHLLDTEGATVEVGAVPQDADGLRALTERLDRHGAPIRAAIESMNGARFVHDRLELAGWQVEIADAQKVKGLAPLACKTDRIDAWVLAAANYSPASLSQSRGKEPSRPACAWSTSSTGKYGDCERELRRLGADHRYVPLLCTVPGISWVLAYTIAAELGDIDRFPTPRKLAGYTGLCPYQSGERDLRGPLSRPLPEDESADRQTARRQGRANRSRPPAHRGVKGSKIQICL
jgi:transposase